MFILDSDYLKQLHKWPDSDDTDELSNIMLNKYKTKLKNYEFVCSANNHLIQKFFMIKNGLYYKSSFIDFTNSNTMLYKIPRKYKIAVLFHGKLRDSEIKYKKDRAW